MILVVLYISVVERTREIGVMKAIGARRKDIRRIFISESFILGLAGGIIATVITFIIMFIGNAVIQSHFGVNMILISPLLCTIWHWYQYINQRTFRYTSCCKSGKTGSC